MPEEGPIDQIARKAKQIAADMLMEPRREVLVRRLRGQSTTNNEIGEMVKKVKSAGKDVGGISRRMRTRIRPK